MNPVVDFISRLPLFEGMNGLELNAVSAFLESRRFTREQCIFSEGDSGDELFIVKSGLVGSFVTQADGSRREIYEFPPGRFFGEMAIIESAPRSATCYAREDSELLVLEGIDFYRMVWEHPVIGVKLLSSMARVMVSWLDETSGFLSDLVRWGETARRRVITDELSGLFNRRFLEENIRLRLSRDSSGGNRCSLLMMDLDRFREINATHGSGAGDSVISTVGAALGRIIREGDIAARLSGDEFAFFLPNTGHDEALSIAELIRREAAELFLEFRAGQHAKATRVNLTVSIGVALCPECPPLPEQLFKAADSALFRAKEGGRNRVELWMGNKNQGK